MKDDYAVQIWADREWKTLAVLGSETKAREFAYQINNRIWNVRIITTLTEHVICAMGVEICCECRKEISIGMGMFKQLCIGCLEKKMEAEPVEREAAQRGPLSVSAVLTMAMNKGELT